MVRKWPVWGFVALCLAVLVAGLIATGGPAQGRAEKRDQVRTGDLSALYQLLLCKARETGSLGTDPTPTEACPMTPRLADPFTAAPYRVELVDAQNLRLCADFEIGVNKQADYFTHDADGCLIERVELE
ncbi:hypothetical protein JJJ17_05450 [Paracoccus caeni]|uniref:Uncharacterized protein n=1 Tax=Paracoccus caeni TaxID=657651 RepID=A0A934SCG4_9RHOB|nr:hypothetical protein [Paracoccus caeni]MBK4215367.1 hypothetical protein [Paracoccus caeni]